MAEVFTGLKGEFVDLETTIQDFKMLVSGDYDDVPEPAFLLKGNMETVQAAARQMAIDLAEQGIGEATEELDETEAVPLVQRRIDALYKFYDARDAEHDAEADLFKQLQGEGKIPSTVSLADYDSKLRSKWTGELEGGKIKKPSEDVLREILA